MKKDLKIKLLEQFDQAIYRLQEALEKEKDDFIRDASIKRFEFTFELTWKNIKYFAKIQGLETNSSREAFKTAFKLGWIKNQDAWLQMIEYRNLSSHTYNSQTADQIYEHLNLFLKYFKKLYSNLCKI
jgi:nucleotidyltransferase substrate binding protein (TIGR01987 family)